MESLSERGRQALVAINRALANGTSSRDIFQAIVKEAVRLCNAERGFLINHQNEIVAAIPASSVQGDPYSQGVFELIMDTAEPLLTIDAMGDPRLEGRQSIFDQDIRSVIAAPLRKESKVSGLIYLDARSESRNFNFEDLALLAALADQAVLAFRLAELNLELEAQMQSAQELSELAMRDELTGLYNRRAFDSQVQALLDQGQSRHLSIIMLDIDNFKHYNDRNGHPAGDAVLIGIAEMFRHKLRDHDIAARYGGEEFIIALPNASLVIAEKVAERLRQAIVELRLMHVEHQPLGFLSASIGVSGYPTHGMTLPVLVNQADEALYKAKESGRNRVVMAP